MYVLYIKTQWRLIVDDLKIIAVYQMFKIILVINQLITLDMIAHEGESRTDIAAAISRPTYLKFTCTFRLKYPTSGKLPISNKYYEINNTLGSFVLFFNLLFIVIVSAFRTIRLCK